MHPGSRILNYVLAALVIPGLSFFLLGLLLLTALTGIVSMGRHPLRLLWRTRWLLLVLILGYGYSVPGPALWGVLGEWSPTWSGLVQGLAYAGRLLVLLLWLDILVLALSPEQLLSGLYALLQPLRLLAVDPGRIALRLALTLKAIEGLEQKRKAAGPRRANLRNLFDPAIDPSMPARVVLQRYPLRVWDVLIPLLLLLAALGTWLWGVHK